MVTAPVPASVYTDVNSLDGLKNMARRQDPEALREVAKQFEAVFMQMLLKSMRAASPGDGGLLDSDNSLFYRDLFDQQLALNLAQGKQFGLADMIVRQLGGAGSAPCPVAAPGTASALATLRPVERIQARAKRPVQAQAASAVGAAAEASPFKPSSPEDFMQHMWSHAQGAARQLGVIPEVLIAQAALETNWGKHVPRFADGQSSHNLFGIKANGRWQGARVTNSTLEFVGGLPQRQRGDFRAYDSYADSFNDYADFLRSNPRYTEALRQGGNSLAFIRALQRAGYATDPDYAGKIGRILNGPVLNQALNSLKLDAG
jgi:flagellar protein FlgJ